MSQITSRSPIADLMAVFPKKVQGSRGCFDTVENAQRKMEAGDRKRHFLAPDEIIELQDTKIAGSTQWGIHSIPRFLKVARSLGMKIAEASDELKRERANER
jgi:DNA-binding transcriptional regulator GbsR (MarR family)